MNKLLDWKKRLKKGHMLSVIVALLVIIVILGIILYKKQREYRQASENSYNMAFYELVDYVQNVETYLAKSLISSTPEHGAETLTNLWREANMAQSYLSRLPIESQELENTEKFLNQVSDYSYSLSRKNIYKESLTQEELNNLKDLHSYSVDLENTLNQLSEDLNSGRFEWGELTKKGTVALAQQVDNISKESFSNLEENFHEYSGLIYDGAFSEHLTNNEKRGLTGDDISEEEARKKAEEFIGKDKIKETNSLGFSENATIPVYDFSINNNDNENINISISKKGGHIVYMNTDRSVNSEIISQEEANEKGKEYLNQKGFDNMRETYYLKQDGIVTINYAYEQKGIVMYPDLIKVKVALDNGEVLGIETTGYLNNHLEQRDISKVKISKEEAKKNLNKELQIEREGLAVIPTEWQTEILCYEFKGKVEDREFLVYINAENGREEDILIITNTPNGTLTL
jgi:spore germination protein